MLGVALDAGLQAPTLMRVRLFWRDLSVSRFERELVVVVARVVDVAFFLCEVVLPVGVEVVVGFEGA